MKTRCLLATLLAAWLLACDGCSKGTDPKSEFSELAQAFPSGAGSNAQPGGPAELVNAALSAIREGDYAAGVVALQSVKRLPEISPEQLHALQGAIQNLTDDLVTRAANGEAKAKAELEAIERTRSQ
jgi:hypothetical protein